ncbi:DUF6285 domain-containing protein [Sphingobium sp. HBC34]|uniref:DUF6285 domain-containing protein n=1 Tax=Sphingobium cyanobacteriorum TaxID=3063954 RepID=A0ABT8ZRT0_9SPHN|nr:DUF6285 domain-containing protein [Sphingobium sp. HBC34]MDO7836425.1 DUF6285 domain-containing protein [Sphingobium sp. HBC34]
MQDEPNPLEILRAVATLLREELMPQLVGASAFNARVAANALDLVQRELALPATAAQEENGALSSLLGMDGDTQGLTTELARRIADRSIDPADPAVERLLWSITEAKLNVDQPAYGGLKRVLALRAAQHHR